MTIGIGLLLDLKSLIFLLTIHSWLSIIFYRTHLYPAKISSLLKLIALLGFFSFTLILSALWFTYFGQGLIRDIELFRYHR